MEVSSASEHHTFLWCQYYTVPAVFRVRMDDARNNYGVPSTASRRKSNQAGVDEFVDALHL